MKIAVVANGYILRMNKWGEEIDAHDLVIRMDGYLGLVSKEIVGNKTDIWATAFNLTYTDNVLDDDRYRDSGTKIWLLRPKEWDNQPCWGVPEWALSRIVHENTEDDQAWFEQDLRNKYPGFKAPSTGLGVLNTARRLFPADAEIDMYGYDFCKYARRYYELFPIPQECDHGFALEKVYIQDLIKEEKRLKCVGLQSL